MSFQVAIKKKPKNTFKKEQVTNFLKNYIMKIYRISQKIGDDITVKSTDIWSMEYYLEEVYDNILNDRPSRSKGQTPTVQKSLEMKRAVFIVDGHHRIVEGILNGQTIFNLNWNKYVPYIDAGIGNELPVDKIKVVDFLAKKKIQSNSR